MTLYAITHINRDGDAKGIYFDDPGAPFDKQMKALGLKP